MKGFIAVNSGGSLRLEVLGSLTGNCFSALLAPKLSWPELLISRAPVAQSFILLAWSKGVPTLMGR